MRIVGVLSVLLALLAEATGDISITTIKPIENEFSGTPLIVIAVVQSTFELEMVEARVEDREVQLVFSEEAYWDKWGEPHPGWVGEISLSGLTKGPQTLLIHVQDVLGGSASRWVNFIFNEKPTLSVEEPLPASVAGPTINVKVSSSDDDEEDCQLEVWAVPSGSPEQLVASGGELMDEEVDLSDFARWELRWQVTLQFRAIDSAGQVTSEGRLVYVVSNARLTHAHSVTGEIWDVQHDHILHLDGDVLKIDDLSSGQQTAVLEGESPWCGFLTPKGAILVTPDRHLFRLLDFRDGQVVDLGQPNSATSLRVKGDYAIWNDGSILVLRDLVTGSNTTVSVNSGNCDNDVTADGEVVYWSCPGYQVYRYHQGDTWQLSNNTDRRNIYPLTDGVHVVYRSSTPALEEHMIALHGPAGEIILAEAMPFEPQPGRDYAVNGGWVAFTKLGTSGQLQVWTRSPSAELEKRSLLGSSTYIEALNPDGEVIFVSGNDKYLSSPGQGFHSLGRYPTNAFWQDGQWLVAIGRTLFTLDTGPPSITLANPAIKSSGDFGFEVQSTNATTVAIQVSSNLETWEDIATEDVSSGAVIFTDVAAKDLGKRFYRARSF